MTRPAPGKTWKRLLGVAALCLACACACADAGAPPQRIVSLNLCTDQLVLLLAEPSRIAALSWLATDRTLSAYAGRAAPYPGVRANAEEVLAHDPDLVIASSFAARATLDRLDRLGRKVLLVEPAEDVEGLSRALAKVGAAIGAEDAARRIVADLDTRMSALARRNASERAPSALVYAVSGIVAGPGTLSGVALRLAGYRNAAAHLDRDRRGAVPLEMIVTHPPDLIVFGHDRDAYRTVQSDNLRHPALEHLLAHVASVTVPTELTICATPRLLDAVDLLAAARPAPGAAR